MLSAAKRLAPNLFTAVLLLYGAAVVAKIALEPDVFQVTVRTYFYGGEVFSKGLSPYDGGILSEAADGVIVMPYTYPPVTLHPLRLLGLFGYSAVYYGFLLAKCAALATLFWLWRRDFTGGRLDGAFLLLCLLGFNASVYWDFSAGNVSTFEQVLLWTGFYCFLRGRLGWFTICVVAVASFKLTPIFFLVLLPFSENRRKWGWLCAGSGLFAAILASSFLFHPGLTRDFLANMGSVVPDTAGYSDNLYYPNPPATWPMIKAVVATVASKTGIAIPANLAAAGFLLWSALVTVVSYAAYAMARPSDNRDRLALAVVLACFVYVFVTPRLMIYSYIIMLAPAYFAVRRIDDLRPIYALLALSAVSTTPYRPPGFGMAADIAYDFYPLLIAYAVWAAFLWHLLTVNRRPDSLSAGDVPGA
ncbi:MAG: DUF2029 domain-containing protein [bacterium]|nr:DUF2029 domain-containing protein [bacterium]